MRRVADRLLQALAAALLPLAVAAAPACDKPVYLTFDTGHMGVAPLVAEVLQRQQVKATFFLANERTLDGGSSLDDAWAPWWKARAAEGHAFGSHTWDHDVWLADAPAGLRVRPTMVLGLVLIVLALQFVSLGLIAEMIVAGRRPESDYRVSRRV